MNDRNKLKPLTRYRHHTLLGILEIPSKFYSEQFPPNLEIALHII